MPIKGSGAAEFGVFDRSEGGVGWIAYPGELMRRASHAIALPDGEGDRELWVVDPVDAAGLDDLLVDHGEVAGVVCCFWQHKRDSAAIATRHGVDVHVPGWMGGTADAIDAPVQRFGRRIADTPIRGLRVRNSTAPPWREAALFVDPDSDVPAAGTLYVPESLGTAAYFRAADERVGVHPAARLLPPREALGGLRPERLRFGHGEGVAEGAAAAMEDALAGARRRLPSAYLSAVRAVVG